MARECPTGKKSFKNKGDATNFMRDFNRRNPTTSKLRNVYECSECGKWHMTTQPRHGHKLAMGKRTRFIEMDDIHSAAFEVRSSQLIDASSLRAPVTRMQKTNRVIRASHLSPRGPIHTSSDERTVRIAQNSSSAR